MPGIEPLEPPYAAGAGELRRARSPPGTGELGAGDTEAAAYS